MYPRSLNISSQPAAFICLKCPDVTRTWLSSALHLTLASSDPLIDVDTAPMTSPAPAWLSIAYSPGTMSCGRPHWNSPRYGYSSSDATAECPCSVNWATPPSVNSVSANLEIDPPGPGAVPCGLTSGITPRMNPCIGLLWFSPTGSTYTSTHDPGAGMHDCDTP